MSGVKLVGQIWAVVESVITVGAASCRDNKRCNRHAPYGARSLHGVQPEGTVLSRQDAAPTAPSLFLDPRRFVAAFANDPGAASSPKASPADFNLLSLFRAIAACAELKIPPSIDGGRVGPSGNSPPEITFYTYNGRDYVPANLLRVAVGGTVEFFVRFKDLEGDPFSPTEDQMDGTSWYRWDDAHKPPSSIIDNLPDNQVRTEAVEGSLQHFRRILWTPNELDAPNTGVREYQLIFQADYTATGSNSGGNGGRDAAINGAHVQEMISIYVSSASAGDANVDAASRPDGGDGAVVARDAEGDALVSDAAGGVGDGGDASDAGDAEVGARDLGPIPNTAPTFNEGAGGVLVLDAVDEGSEVRARVTAQDPEGDPIRYEVVEDSLPDGARVELLRDANQNPIGMGLIWDTQIGDGRADVNGDLIPYVVEFHATDRDENDPAVLLVQIPVRPGPFDLDGDGFLGTEGHEDQVAANRLAPNGLPWDCADDDATISPLFDNQANRITRDREVCPGEVQNASIVIASDPNNPQPGPITVRPYGYNHGARVQLNGSVPAGQNVAATAVLVSAAAVLQGFDGLNYRAAVNAAPRKFIEVNRPGGVVQITDVHADNNDKGIIFSNAGDARIEDSNLSDQTSAIEVNSSDNASISGVEISNPGTAVTVTNSSGVVLQDAEITGVGVAGVVATDAEGLQLNGVGLQALQGAAEPNGIRATRVDNASFDTVTMDGFTGIGLELTASDSDFFNELGILTGGVGVKLDRVSNSLFLGLDIFDHVGVGLWILNCGNLNTFMEAEILRNNPNLRLPEGVECSNQQADICHANNNNNVGDSCR